MRFLDIIKSGNAILFEARLAGFTNPNINGYNVLHETIARDKLELSKIAVNMCPDLIFGADYPFENTPLMYAIQTNDIHMVRVFDDHPVAFSIANTIGELPLLFAVRTKQLDIVKYVLEKYPAAIEWRNDKNQSSLHIACQLGCPREILEFLYTESQDHADSFGNFPIHLYGEYAIDVNRGSEGSVSFLVERNPSVLFRQTKSGNTPLHSLSMIRAMRDSVLRRDIQNLCTSKTLEIRNYVGLLPSHIAALYHDVELVNHMISVDPSILYEKTLSSKSIFTFLVNSSKEDKLSLIVCILSGNFEIRPELWDFFPRNLIDLEKHLHAFRDEFVKNCMPFVTISGKRRIVRNLTSLYTFIKRHDRWLEPRLVKTIVLLSLKNN